MPSHSSIFSFRTLRLQAGVAWGLLFSLLLLIAIDFAVSRREWPYQIANRQGMESAVGDLLHVENTLRQTGMPLHLALLGDSHTKKDFSATTLISDLKLPAGAVANLGVGGGDCYDFSLLHRRNPDRLAAARLLVYGVDVFQFNAHHPFSARFEHFATLSERLQLDPSPHRLIGGLFRTEEKAQLFPMLWRGLALEYEAKLGWHAENTAPPIEPFSVKDVVDGSWYRNFQLSTSRIELFRKVLEQAKIQKQRVLIVQLPCRDDFMQELMLEHAAQYAAYKQCIHQFESLAISIIFFESAADCGLNAADFEDHNHLSSPGAKKFSHFFVNWLKQNHPELVATAQVGNGQKTEDLRP